MSDWVPLCWSKELCLIGCPCAGPMSCQIWCPCATPKSYVRLCSIVLDRRAMSDYVSLCWSEELCQIWCPCDQLSMADITLMNMDKVVCRWRQTLSLKQLYLLTHAVFSIVSSCCVIDVDIADHHLSLQ